MKLVERDMEKHLEKYGHIKDALARVIVEMIKREWPQQWPTLLEELQMASSQGPGQTEQVLLIFLRLAEDVALLQVIIYEFVYIEKIIYYYFNITKIIIQIFLLTN